MKRASALLNLLMALSLILHPGCATTRARPGGEAEPRAVRTSPLSGGRLKLSFEPVATPPASDVLRWKEVQGALSVLEAALLTERPLLRIVSPPGSSRFGMNGQDWEPRLREEFQSGFGLSLLPMPEALEHSRLFQALKQSPRYMGAGVREAAHEMFDSPAFVASVCLSVVVYFAAWMAPEPALKHL